MLIKRGEKINREKVKLNDAVNFYFFAVVVVVDND